VITTIIYNISY